MIKRLLIYVVLAISMLLLISFASKFVKMQSTTDVVVQQEPKKSSYVNETDCWAQDNSWTDLEGCSELRQKKYSELEVIENQRQLLNLAITNQNANFPNTYISEKYGYSFSYPDGWYTEEYDVEGITNVTLRKYDFDYSNDDPNTYKYPLEIIIGHGQSYSTSGALCANQYCENGGTAKIPWRNEDIQLVKGASIVDDETGKPYTIKLNFYRFSFNIKENPYIYVLSTFFNEKQGSEILDILNTLKY